MRTVSDEFQNSLKKFITSQGSDNLENQGKPGKRSFFRGIREIHGKSLPNFDLSGKLKEFFFADNFF